jgi:hypothetical protein
LKEKAPGREKLMVQTIKKFKYAITIPTILRAKDYSSIAPFLIRGSYTSIKKSFLQAIFCNMMDCAGSQLKQPKSEQSVPIRERRDRFSQHRLVPIPREKVFRSRISSGDNVYLSSSEKMVSDSARVD